MVQSPPAKSGDGGAIPGPGRSVDAVNGVPLQDSESPTDRRAWRAAVRGVTESRTRLREHAHARAHLQCGVPGAQGDCVRASAPRREGGVRLTARRPPGRLRLSRGAPTDGNLAWAPVSGWRAGEPADLGYRGPSLQAVSEQAGTGTEPPGLGSSPTRRVQSANRCS